MSTLRITALVAGLALAGCGSNNTDVPEGLLRAIDEQGTAGYPKGPYGVNVGDTVQNLCFQGWKDPKAANYDPAAFEPLCLSDFHEDPDVRLLLVESCAIWCVACRAEYGGSGTTRPSLAQYLAERESKGFRVFGTLFQDVNTKPAQPTDAVNWATTFEISFPFALDQDHKLGLFVSSNVAPYNLLIDTKTMRIVLGLAGDEPSTLFSKVDEFLAAPAE